ncbi:MAG: class I adenylate-forming enzyme family protein [Acidimicrobiales bacterium]
MTDRVEAFSDRTAMVHRDVAHSYARLARRAREWSALLADRGIPEGSTVSVTGDFDPETVAALMALIDHRCMVVPLLSGPRPGRVEALETAQVQWELDLMAQQPSISRTGRTVDHELLLALRRSAHAGIVLYSSGSAGTTKAVLHDCDRLLRRFDRPSRALRTLAFLLFDHIGGLNTLLHTLLNGGCLVVVSERSPDHVCAAVERHRVTLLPTSPTFLNQLILSEAAHRHDLSSLTLITYGTEVMPEVTLRRMEALLPWVRLKQTYGLSEVGILPSLSPSSTSTRLQLGGRDGYETRVVDGLLEVRAPSAMLGYLNAPSPFTPDGWFRTGDAVQVEGESLRVLGRRSEMINVGGEKVFPAEIESVIIGMDGVEDVTVSGEPNALVGQIVAARVKLSPTEPADGFRNRLRHFCKGKLEPFKVPQRIELVDHPLHGARYKKLRSEGERTTRPEVAV